MPIDASIPLQVQPVKIESGANQLAMMESAAKMQELNRANEDRNALRGLDPNSPDYVTKVSQINPALGMQMGAHKSLMAKQGVETEAAQYKLGKDKTNTAILAIANLDSPQAALEDLNRRVQAGEIPLATAQQHAQQIQNTPWKQYKTNTIDSLLNAHEKATLDESRITNRTNSGIAQQNANTNAYNATKPTFVAEYGGYVSPPSKNNPKGGFTPITNAEGTPLQSIKSLSPQETAVLSQAIVEGRLDPNAVNSRNQKTLAATLLANPTANLVNLHGDVVGTNAEARTTGTQGAKITMSATEASNMIGLVNDYSSKVDRTQYPSLNAVQNAVSKGTGGEDIVRFNNSINALINTYARAINPNGVATVSDKNHARDLLSSAFSNGQVNAATQVMQQEIDAALASPGQARQKLKENRIGTGSKTNTPALPSGYVVD